MKELLESSYLSAMSEANNNLRQEIERLNNIIKRADDLLELKQLRYLNEDSYKICTLDLQEVRNILQDKEEV